MLSTGILASLFLLERTGYSGGTGYSTRLILLDGWFAVEAPIFAVFSAYLPMPMLASDRSRDATGLSALAAVATLPTSFVILEPLDRLPLALLDCAAVFIVLLVLD